MTEPKMFWERPLVYVAGPYRTPDPVVNTRNAVLAGDELNDTGLVTAFVPHLTLLWHIVCPHCDLTAAGQAYWYEYDMTVLNRSDALYRLPGESTGADAEMAFAVERGTPVFDDRSKLLDWAVENAG